VLELGLKCVFKLNLINDTKLKKLNYLEKLFKLPHIIIFHESLGINNKEILME
jgi:hypothetical protein